MKLNLGCGNNRKNGYINVDKYLACNPDLVMDCEVFPWKFSDNEIEEIIFNHSLEHMGADADIFLNIISEVYRVCKSKAILQIHVPHPRHDNFLGDPTHVRVITPQLLSLFSKKNNLYWKEMGNSNTPFASYLGVDFEIRNVVTVLEHHYLELLNNKKITEEELEKKIKENNNIVVEYQITLEVIK